MDPPASWKLVDEFFIPGKDLPPDIRGRYAQISHALHGLGAMKNRFNLAPLVDTDDDFVVMNACWQAEQFCENYQTINTILKELGEEIKLISRELFAVFEKSSTEITEIVATLLAYLSTESPEQSICKIRSVCLRVHAGRRLKSHRDMPISCRFKVRSAKMRWNLRHSSTPKQFCRFNPRFKA